MFWFLLILVLFLWAFGLKGTVKIILLTGLSLFVFLSLLVAFG
jgi:hypothetical protein|tara:strand:+ start:84 stop:212 length:129 start_codon:yes stop_codon:yes gene_type:complete